MYKQTLNSIPETDVEEGRKWVPKKKHEVLKAKYKCLKKLFQLYDATVIGTLPEQNSDIHTQEKRSHCRRKRSNCCKTDACADTSEISKLTSIELPQNDQSCISTQFDAKVDRSAETVAEIDDFREETYHNRKEFYPSSWLPQERPKLTRFQCFLQRLFNIRQHNMTEEDQPYCLQMYSASDCTIKKRRYKGLRFRRIRRPRNIQSEGDVDLKTPAILSYVQSAQRSCLLDTTPRYCPVVGCKMVSYGIINYNDHLNIYHFKDRKYNCHYCHEGFISEKDKLLHEDEHIGINKLNQNTPELSNQSLKTATDTQTDPEAKITEEKLKKIVSFFDKMADKEVANDIMKKKLCECNFRCENSNDDKTWTVSCCDLRKKTDTNRVSSIVSAPTTGKRSILSCHLCGENFQHRRQLSLHLNSEHRPENPSKHISFSIQKRINMVTQSGCINVHSDPPATSTRNIVNVPYRNIQNVPNRNMQNVPYRNIENVPYSNDENDRYKSLDSLSYAPSKISCASSNSVLPVDTRYSWEPGSVVRL